MSKPNLEGYFNQPQEEETASTRGASLERHFSQDAPQEEEGGVSDTLYNVGANLNVGLSRLFGFAGDIDEALFTEDSYFPTSDEIQSGLASVGATYEPGEEPQGFMDRLTQEIGTIGLPVAGQMARGSNLLSRGISEGRTFLQRGAIESARRPGRTLRVEGSAATGAVAGGMAGEQMAEGEESQVGRAIGELAGGLSGGFLGAGGMISPVARGAKRLGEPFTPSGGKRRATERVSRGTRSASQARERLQDTQDIAEEVPTLTPAQQTNDPFMAQLEQAVRQESPEAMESLSQRTAESSRRLKQIANRTGDVEDVRRFLDTKFKEAAAKSSAATQRLRTSRTPEDASMQTRKLLEDAYEVARDQESKIWQRVPSSVRTNVGSAREVWADELSNLTEGADRSELPVIIRNKLGQLNNQGKLVGGELGDKPSAKAVHDFYSVLGRKMAQESGKPSPNRNKLRIINDVRRSLLRDLEEVDGGESYTEALSLSRDLNRKFTEGGVGQVLGLSGGRAANTTETLDALMGTSGEAQRNAVKQLLEASPQSEEQVKDFVRNRFMDAAFNRENERIVPKNAANFLNKYRPLLREFPDLRDELKGAAKNQKNLDSLLGASDVTDISARAKSQRAAGVFLQAPPGEEIGKIVNSARRGPNTVTQQFNSLVQEVNQDETGDALRGLKSAFTDHVMVPSGREDASGELMISGRQMMNRLDELGDPAVKSGLLKRDELNRLKKIARVFEGLETSERAKGAAEGVIDDQPAMLLRIASRMIPARATQLTPSGGAGVGLQEAQIAASEGQNFVRRLTNKGAYHLLTRAVQDRDTMDDLLKNVENMSVKEQRKLTDRLRANLPKGSFMPAATTAVGQEEQE